MPLREHCGGGSPADRLQAEGPGAGKKIDREGVFHGWAHKVEKHLADAVFHRTRAAVGREREPLALQFAADDPRWLHSLGRVGGAGGR